MTVALFPTNSNPPTFGTILALKYVEDLYEKIFVVIRDKPLMISTAQAVNMIEKVLCTNTHKYAVISNDCDFENTTILPKQLPAYDVIITDNPNIYSNLLSKGYINMNLIPKPLGYDETMHRVAYKRSLILERILDQMRTIRNPDEYMKEVKKENKGV
jgi:hypothetical protein